MLRLQGSQRSLGLDDKAEIIAFGSVVLVLSFQDNLLRIKHSTFCLISVVFFYLLFEFLNLLGFTLYYLSFVCQ